MIIEGDILFAVFDTDIKNGTFIIPGKIKIIASYVFDECESLLSVSIPDNVYKINSCAFNLCENIYSIKLPHNLKILEPAAFRRNKPGLKIIYDEFQLKFAQSIKDEYGETVELVLKPYSCEAF